MSRRIPPSFDFYVDDFVAGTNAMHPLARGIYISLLCHQWSEGAIPDPDTKKRELVQITGAMPDELSEHLPQVLEKFEQGEDGKYRNPRLLQTYRKAAEVRDKRLAALESANRKRADSAASAAANGQPDGEPGGDASGAPDGKKEEGRRKTLKKENEWQIPERLDTPEVRSLLVDFAAMRRDIKKPIRNVANTSRVLEKFDDVSHLIHALEFCIANEYQGLKPEYRPESKPKKKERVRL